MTRILLIALTLATIVLVMLAWMNREDPFNPQPAPDASQQSTEQSTNSLPSTATTPATAPVIPDSAATTAVLTPDLNLAPLAYVPYVTPKSERSKVIVASMRPTLQNALNSTGFRLGDPIYIRIFKESKELEIWFKKGSKFALYKTYPIATFSGSLGPKLKEGDKQSPEGFYFVTPRMLNPNSKYHLAFNIGYPNKYDQKLGRTGSAIMVHGDQQSIGCYAMTDPVIEEIYTLVDAALSAGQKFFRVHIFPFHMTDANMKRHIDSRHIDFWNNLKEGYDAFEKTRNPPNVTTRNHRYRFN